MMTNFKNGQKIKIKPGLEKEFPALLQDEDIPTGTPGTIDSVKSVFGVQICFVSFHLSPHTYVKKIPGDFLAPLTPDRK